MIQPLRHALLTLTILLSCGCVSQAERGAAAETVDQMQAATKEREAAVRQQLTQLARAALAQAHDRIQAQWKQRVAEQEVWIWQQVEAKQIELRTRAIGDLEQAIDPTLQQLDKDLKAERTNINRTGRERELQLAAQFASTLAVTTHEGQKMAEWIDQRLVQVRRKLIDQLRNEAKAMPGEFDPAAEADKLVTDWAATNASAYTAAMDHGYDQLKRYVLLDNAVVLMLKGLVGDQLGAALGDRIGSMAETLQNKAWQQGQAIVDKFHDRITGAISDAATAMANDKPAN